MQVFLHMQINGLRYITVSRRFLLQHNNKIYVHFLKMYLKLKQNDYKFIEQKIKIYKKIISLSFTKLICNYI